MEVCPVLSVLCCPVEADALGWTDPTTSESYQISDLFIHNFRTNSELERVIRPKP
jgi:hypothetical protein